MKQDNDAQQGGMLQIEISPDVAQGVYANLAMIAHSPSEFILDFACVLPGLPKAPVKSRVVIAPEHAKRLLFALQENVAKYEQMFGPIDLHTGESRTVSPFRMPQGDA